MYLLGFNINSDQTTIRRLCLYDIENGLKYENINGQVESLILSKRKFHSFRDMVFNIDKDKFKKIHL